MANVTVTYPDGDRATADAAGSYADLARVLGKRLGRDIVAVVEDDRVVDLARPAKDGAAVRFVPLDSAEGAEVLRHSAAHMMAEAVQDLFPGTKVTIGPAIENGFYYDFDVERPFSPEDFEKIETRMRETIAKDAPFVRREVSRDEAASLFASKGETYKVEIIGDLPEGAPLTLYEHNGWVDLCRGPHLPSTGFVKSFKLLSVAGAYWRGDERNPMLSRIYGLAFPDDKALAKYLNFLEEAKRRDHRRLGKDLELFLLSDEVGSGLPIWLPKGARLRSLLEQWEREEHFRRGYEIVIGPQILKTDLWVRSGHYDHYRENMYFTEVEGQGYGIKPMNCLAHMLIYKSKTRSFRDLPLRYFELGTVHRHEKSGVLHGLLRVRAFTQDDAHILCTPEQLVGEIQGVIDFVADAMAKFGFEYELELSTRPANSIGSDQDWERATDALARAMKERGLSYQVNEGDGAFYGPKIDVKIKDCLGRLWQCATIQCDFTMPERFELEYVGSDNQPHRPVMVHRVILGSIERFIGVLIEHYAGAFPAWLAPVQAMVLPITDAQNDYVREVVARLIAEGFRAAGDLRNEKIGYKIREATKQKVPYMLVVGEKERAAGTVAPRTRKGEDRGAMPLEAFIEVLRADIHG
jgi:threonyl-tRNA synthetase